MRPPRRLPLLPSTTATALQLGFPRGFLNIVHLSRYALLRVATIYCFCHWLSLNNRGIPVWLTELGLHLCSLQRLPWSPIPSRDGYVIWTDSEPIATAQRSSIFAIKIQKRMRR